MLSNNSFERTPAEDDEEENSSINCQKPMAKPIRWANQTKQITSNSKSHGGRCALFCCYANKRLGYSTKILSVHLQKRNLVTFQASKPTLILMFIYYLSHFISFTQADIVIISPANRTTEIFDDSELPYGFITLLEDTPGKIVLAQPEDACSEVQKAPNTFDTWFLLAKRYPCPIEAKVRNAAEAGYKAIIIYNVDPNTRSTLLTTQSTMQAQQIQDSATNQTPVATAPKLAPVVQYNTYIPGVMISFIDGLEIKQNYMADKGYTALILARIPLNAYLLPFAIAIILCLFLMVSFLVFQIIRCVRSRRRVQRHRLTKRQLKQLLTTIYTKGSQYDTCAICLEEYLEGEKLRVLPCGHGYHLRCIDPWLTKSRRICPVCKGKVRVSGMSDTSDIESDSEHSRHVYNTNANESTPLLREQQQRINRSQRNQSPPETPPHQHQGTSVASAANIMRAASVNGSINGVYSDTSSSQSATTISSTATPNPHRVYVDAGADE